MNLTNCLLVVILFILLKQFYPASADTFTTVGIAALAIYGCYWLTQVPARWKKHRAETRQQELDEREFWDYQKKHDAIRAKYDPRQEWDEATSVPRAYLEEIRGLNLEHRGMLQRRNGWTATDFPE